MEATIPEMFFLPTSLGQCLCFAATRTNILIYDDIIIKRRYMDVKITSETSIRAYMQVIRIEA